MVIWSKHQGLPDDSVTSVLQSRDGYIWVGTSGGLARFDGVRFVKIALPAGKTKGAISVTALCEDSAERLWIGTQTEGLLCRENGIVSTFPGDDSLRGQTINSIAEDIAGNLWVGTPSGLIWIKGDQTKLFTTKHGLPNDFVSNINVARSGTVWITTRDGICQFKEGRIEPIAFQTDSPGRNPECLGVYEDRRGKLWAFGDTYLVNLTEGKHLNHFRTGEATASTRIWSLCEGRDGELWIGTSGKGLYCFTDEKFVPLSLNNNELANDVRAICEDREGNLWLGTRGGGLVRLQARNIHVLDTSVGLPSRPAVCLGFNAQGNSWIGFERGGLYEGFHDSFERLSGKAGPDLQNLVSSICVAPDSSLWIGTLGSGLFYISKHQTVNYTTADGLLDDSVLSLAMDSENAVWVGTSSGLHQVSSGRLTSFGKPEGLPDQPVTAILAARGGGVWIGFDNGEVFRGNHGQFHQVSKQTAATDAAVRALCEDSAGRLWLGTAGGHVACVTGHRFLEWDMNSGSANKSVLGIIMNEDGDLWLGTDGAVYCVAQKSINALLSGQSQLRPQLIFKADSQPNVTPPYGWPRALQGPDGKLWFGLNSGVVTFNLSGPMADSTSPPVLIEAVVVNDRPLPQSSIRSSALNTKDARIPVRLSSDLRSLEIQFTALQLSAPEKLRFRHRLDGFDPDWVVDGDGGRDVHYGRLPYGTYRFRVQAGNSDQAWFENEASFHFLIPTPIWRTHWALAGYGVASLLVAAGVARLISVRRFRRRLAAISAQQAMERERMRIARDMHDEIGSKLTKISFMSERAKNEFKGQEPAMRTLDSIACTSRDLLQTLDEIVWAVNPHNDTLENLAAYLGQYATEYLQNTDVDCELHMPPGLPHHPLSAEARHNLFLAFEESLNNALKHGRASHVRVDMLSNHSRFEIKIQDNGCGFDSHVPTAAQATPSAPKRGGNGLHNMRQRLLTVGGQCIIQSSRGKGTTVSLIVPIGNSSKN